MNRIHDWVEMNAYKTLNLFPCTLSLFFFLFSSSTLGFRTFNYN